MGLVGPGGGGRLSPLNAGFLLIPPYVGFIWWLIWMGGILGRDEFILGYLTRLLIFTVVA